MGKRSTELLKSAIFVARPEYMAHPNKAGGKPFLYAFYVIDIDKGRVLRTFGFDIPPQQIRLEEEAAADIVATQDGGYWSDERGQYFKMLTLGGTFGYRPTPQSGNKISDPLGVRASAEQVSRAVSALRGERNISNIPDNERTGNARYMDLHNIIRYYWDLKQTRTMAGSVVFIWADWKMGEVYIAQPLRFTRDRNAPSNRLKISYNLTLRLLEPLDVPRTIDFIKPPNGESGQVNWLRKIQQVSDVLDASSKLLTNTVSAAIDYGSSVSKTIFSPINSVVNSLRDGVSVFEDTLRTGLDIVNIPLYSLQTVHRAALDAAIALRSANAGFTDISYQYEKIGRDIASVFVGVSVVQKETDVNTEARAMGKKYKKWDTDAALDQSLDPDGVQIVGDGGSKTSLGNNNIPRGSTTVTFPARTSIKQFASEFLGDAGLWKAVVLLNRLVPPYISPRGDGKTVLRPGDPIKIPSEPDRDGDENQVFSVWSDDRNTDAYRYGRDIKMDLDTYDLVVSEKGDLDVVEGLDNLTQAMNIKLITKPGDLKIHKYFGFSAEAGDGLDVDILAQYHLELRRTIMSDTRIEKINSITMRAVGDVLAIKASLLPKNQDSNLDLTFRARL